MTARIIVDDMRKIFKLGNEAGVCCIRNNEVERGIVGNMAQDFGMYSSNETMIPGAYCNIAIDPISL